MSAYVTGFKASGISSGIKQNGRKDLGLIFSEVPAVTCGMFTTNAIPAPSVTITKEKIRHKKAQAIVVNSGNANACTGQQGQWDAHSMCSSIAMHLSIPEQLVLVSSTGIIGVPLPLERIKKCIPRLVSALSPQGMNDFAEAIMTTDTFPKIITKSVNIEGKNAALCGIAKGAGMIMPRMATLLCFILTDIAIEADLLYPLLREAVSSSFNSITIDGDTSTNDMILVLANGTIGNTPLTLNSPDVRLLKDTFNELLMELAKLVLKDAEGATKVVTIKVEGAYSTDDAMRVAYQVANSCLVKVALYGEDVNWGRIMAAIGNAKATISPQTIDIYFDKVKVVEHSVGTGLNSLAKEVMRKPEYTITIDLHNGKEKAEIFTTDLSVEYIRINSSYPT